MSTLTRRDPLDDLFRGFFVKPMDYPAEEQSHSIKMDVREQKDAYLVHAEIPGAKKEDVHVLIDGNQVSISAEVKPESDPLPSERILRSERYFGQASRVFQLSHEIDDLKAVAKFNNGLLELSLPKKQASSNRRLVID